MKMKKEWLEFELQYIEEEHPKRNIKAFYVKVQKRVYKEKAREIKN